MIADILALLNADMVKLADFANLQILLGPEFLADATFAPPRIVVVPTKDSFGMAQQHNTVNQPPSRLDRPLYTCNEGWEVHCWAVVESDVPADQFDATRNLYRAFIAATTHVANGAFEFRAGEWTRSTYVATHGREYVLYVTCQNPVLDTSPLAAAPIGTVGSLTGVFDEPDGSSTTVNIGIVGPGPGVPSNPVPGIIC